ncbi:hypothetical protein LTR36_007360 [Oleoguttula mirabilis]|uniref:Uncharacterized protein n=1 Tax=Oleoguttula mirabilis TaxID=1507867 RepID=A0AAV9JAF4_9PEZI|nr:hypothetical protein LTR36_007360 [Oleoguttula mirabilis]
MRRRLDGASHDVVREPCRECVEQELAGLRVAPTGGLTVWRHRKCQYCVDVDAAVLRFAVQEWPQPEAPATEDLDRAAYVKLAAKDWCEQKGEQEEEFDGKRM